MGLGKTLLKAYLQRMEGSGIADRVALIAKPELVGWYVGRFGFQEKGESQVGFGGGGWRDLVSVSFPFFGSFRVVVWGSRMEGAAVDI